MAVTSLAGCVLTAAAGAVLAAPGVVVFAASPLAAYMTGSALMVDGGELQQ